MLLRQRILPLPPQIWLQTWIFEKFHAVLKASSVLNLPTWAWALEVSASDYFLFLTHHHPRLKCQVIRGLLVPCYFNGIPGFSSCYTFNICYNVLLVSFHERKHSDTQVLNTDYTSMIGRQRQWWRKNKGYRDNYQWCPVEFYFENKLNCVYIKCFWPKALWVA